MCLDLEQIFNGSKNPLDNGNIVEHTICAYLLKMVLKIWFLKFPFVILDKYRFKADLKFEQKAQLHMSKKSQHKMRYLFQLWQAWKPYDKI